MRWMVFCCAALFASVAVAADPWLSLPGGDGAGKGKRIVLISGDEEYRSEEALPQLGKILSKHHGFDCTVLFPIDPETGDINPEHRFNIPGLEKLADADLMVVFLRFRELPEDQMQHFVKYLDSGKPIVALRTATHAFNIGKDKPFAKFSYNSGDESYSQGFGRQVLGETWISHHGSHGKESTRGVPAPGQEGHPILRGISCGTIWGPSDVYGVRLPLPGDSRPVVLGQVLKGMQMDDDPVSGAKNDPMMPIAWTKTYAGASGHSGRVFTTTMGAATDLAARGTRRMIVNGCYWALGLEEKIDERSNVDLVGKYEPSPFKFGGHKKGVKPADLAE